MNTRLIIRLCGGCLLFVSVVSRADDLGTVRGTQWSPYLQWQVDNPTWSGNAFDVQATAVFTHEPSGETRRTELFYMGRQSWAFRFSGTKIGKWSFVTTSEDEDLAGHTGEVMIVANPRLDVRGFLKQFGGKWGKHFARNRIIIH